MDAVEIQRKGRWRFRAAVLPGAVIAVGLVLTGADAPWAQTVGRVIYMAAVEMKGAAQKEKEPYPEAPLPSGAGYVRPPPNAAGRWEVSAYQWSPGTIVARQGETVTLEIVGVNGDVHPSTIPGLVDTFTVKRGEVTRLTFMANKPGLYPIICTKHVPSMQGTLVILPN
jgi:heme/copper-type cytochrome/quinol oxidase subunit 2